MDDILIRGVPFWALGHHDGRFVRAPGLFAFARRQPSGCYEVLHLEVAEAINCSASSGHVDWAAEAEVRTRGFEEIGAIRVSQAREPAAHGAFAATAYSARSP